MSEKHDKFRARYVPLSQEDRLAAAKAAARQLTGLEYQHTDPALVEMLRDARPPVGFYCTISPDYSEAILLSNVEVNYDWLLGVIEEGFDSIAGPTYWRVAETDKRRRYSTFILNGNICLLTTDLE